MLRIGEIHGRSGPLLSHGRYEFFFHLFWEEMSIPIIMSMHAGVQDTGEDSPNLLKPSQGFGRLQEVG